LLVESAAAMNFAVESAAMQAAEDGERQAAQSQQKSPTSLQQKKNFIYGRPQTAPPTSSFDPTKLMSPDQDKHVWSLMQSRLFSQSHDHLNNNAFSHYNQASHPFFLNSATIPEQYNGPSSGNRNAAHKNNNNKNKSKTQKNKQKQSGGSSSSTSMSSNTSKPPTKTKTKTINEPPLKPVPVKEMSAKRKKWLAQLMKKKARLKERAEILAKDPHAFDHEKTTGKKTRKKKPSSSSSSSQRKKKRGNADMSASDYESDGADNGVMKFRRTSKASKVDSSSEMSDTDSPRQYKYNTGSSTSEDLDEIFDDLNVGGGRSSDGSSDVSGHGDYTLDHMHFLDESNNVRRNQGRTSRGSNSSRNRHNNGRPSTSPAIFGSTNLDLSFSRPDGESLDDSLRFWESTAVSAQQDLQSFVSDFAAPPREESLTPPINGPRVVETLFDLNNDDLEDDSLERSWMQATNGARSMNGSDIDPLAFSVGSVNGLGNSQMLKMFQGSESMLTKSMEEQLDVSL